MATVQYFDRRGRELSQWEAKDSRGVLYDGVTVKVKKMMRDANPKRRVVDGYRPDNWKSLHRPGFRNLSDSLDSILDDTAKADAYAEHAAYLRDAYKLGATAPVVGKPTTARIVDQRIVCPDCGGEGDIDGDQCERCDGEGEIDDEDYEQNDSVRHADRRTGTVDQMRANHARNMTRIYDQVEHDLCEAWKKGGK